MYIALIYIKVEAVSAYESVELTTPFVITNLKNRTTLILSPPTRTPVVAVS